MPRVYVVAMQDSVRVAPLIEELKSQLLEFKVQNAIDGRKIDLANSDLWYQKNGTYARLGYHISGPLLGCALSHKSIYSKEKENEDGWILILEEDVRLQPNFRNAVMEVISKLPTNGAIVCQLFTRGERFIQKKSIFEISTGRFLYKFACIPGQTAAYLINRAALKKANLQFKLIGPPDWPNWSHDVTFYGTYPFLVTENDLETTIGSPPISRSNYWVRVLQKASLIHFLKHFKTYPSILAYLKFEIRPLWNHFYWKLRRSPRFPKDARDGLWII